MKHSSSPNLPRTGGGGLTVQELKQMTALRMSQQVQPAAPSPHPAPGHHQYLQRGKYPVANGEDRRPRHTPPPKGGQRMADKHKSPDCRGKPQEPSMPHGLTVQELKELTRIRLEREAMEKLRGASPQTEVRSVSDTSSASGVSDSDVPAVNRVLQKPAPTYFSAAGPNRQYPNNSRINQQVMMHPNAKPKATMYVDGKNTNHQKADRPGRSARRPGVISDTSSTISLSSSSTEGTSDLRPVPSNSATPILQLPQSQPEPWELVGDVHLENSSDDSSRPSAMGSVIRQILAVDISEPSSETTSPIQSQAQAQAVAPPPIPVSAPSSPNLFIQSGMVPNSPRSMKNRPQIAMDCPHEIRRRSRSDSLAYEMAEAVLGTPPGSPVQPIINRKRMVGGSATALLLATSPSTTYSALDSSVPEENFFRRDSGSHPVDPMGGFGGSMFRRGSGASRKGSGSSDNTTGSLLSFMGSNAQTSEAGSFFPRRAIGTSSVLSLFQTMAADSGDSVGSPSQRSVDSPLSNDGFVKDSSGRKLPNN